MYCDARFHSTLALLHRLVTALARRQRLPVTGRTPSYIPTAALTQQAPGTRGGGRARVHWMRRDDHVRGQEKKKRKGRRDLLGIVSQRKNIFMRLELWHEKSMSLVKRFGSLDVLLFLVQLHSVKPRSLISCGCQEERQYHCEFRKKKINHLNRCVSCFA